MEFAYFSFGSVTFVTLKQKEELTLVPETDVRPLDMMILGHCLSFFVVKVSGFASGSHDAGCSS